MKFYAYPEGRGDDGQVIEASSPGAAAVMFAEDWDSTAHRVVVSDELARVYVVELNIVTRVEAEALRVLACSGDDLCPDDPMPTPEAETLRDARYAEVRP